MSRERLPRNRRSITHQFRVGPLSGWLAVGMYDDGRPGEVYITIAKAGSTMRGIVDSWAITISHALQNGVDIGELTSSMIDVTYEPTGETGDPEIPTASSITDYIGRRILLDFPANQQQGAAQV